MFRSVRILVTDSCNLNCNYCHNEGILKGHSILGYEFFESFVEQISTIATVEKIKTPSTKIISTPKVPPVETKASSTVGLFIRNHWLRKIIG